MNKIRISLLALVAAVLVAAMPAYAQTYKVDAAKTEIKWRGKKVSGEHYGPVKLKNGTLTFAGGKLTGGELVVDLSTIAVGDMQGEYADKLAGHLKSADFFDVAKYPTAKLVITKATTSNNKDYDIAANLTIKDKTVAVTFKAEVEIEGGKVEAEAKLTVDRTKFGITYAGKADDAINKDFELKVELEAAK